MDTLNNNWCIKLDAENRDVVIKYLNEKCNMTIITEIGVYYGLLDNLFYYDKYAWGTGLTFEEFKTQILGEGYKSNILGTSKNNPPINKFLSDLDNDTISVVPSSNEVKSDGGSAKYYQIEITNSKGEKFNCELNDILRDVFNNQWDLCNIVKASRRISEARKGQGKKDVSIQYDANKIIWFAEEIKKYGK